MTIENQVTSLELSKQLKKLGVKQESQFYWIKIAGKWKVQWFNFGEEFSEKIAKRKDLISAFTVAELGEMYTKYNFKLKGADLVYAIDLILKTDILSAEFFNEANVLDELIQVMKTGTIDDTDFSER